MLIPETPTNFMHSCFPATPGTYVLTRVEEATGGFTREPVIAWAPDAENPYRAPWPLTMNGVRRLTDEAILHPCGMVSDPHSPVAFNSPGEWLKYQKGGARTPATTPTKPEDAESPEQEPSGGNDLGLDLSWTNKTLKTNSFWQYSDEDYEFLFVVDGGKELPEASDTVVKIKRDEFMALKKANTEVMEYDDLISGGPEEGQQEDPEEEEDTDDLI